MAGFWDGTFADYGTAIGTVGLAALAAASLVRESRDRKELRDERDAERKRADQLERDAAERLRTEAAAAAERAALAYGYAVTIYQAGKVSYDPRSFMRPDSRPPAEGTPIEAVEVRNIADAPIRNVTIEWLNARAEDAVRSYVVERSQLRVLGAMGRRYVPRPSSMSTWDQHMLLVQVRFTDINGHDWVRVEDGRLFEIRPDGAIGEQQN